MGYARFQTLRVRPDYMFSNTLKIGRLHIFKHIDEYRLVGAHLPLRRPPLAVNAIYTFSRVSKVRYLHLFKGV